MFGKKVLVVMLIMTASVFAAQEREKHDCFANIRSSDTEAFYKFVKTADGNFTLVQFDNSKSEQFNSGVRAFTLSTIIGFIAQGFYNEYGAVAHMLGAVGTVAANVFVGGVACQDRKLSTRIGGGVSGYMTGAIGRSTVKFK